MATGFQRAAALTLATAFTAGCATTQSFETPTVGNDQRGLKDPCVMAGILVVPTNVRSGPNIVESEATPGKRFVLREVHNSAAVGTGAGAAGGAVAGGLLGRVLTGRTGGTVGGALLGGLAGAVIGGHETGTARLAYAQNCVDTVRRGGFDTGKFGQVQNMPR